MKRKLLIILKYLAVIVLIGFLLYRGGVIPFGKNRQTNTTVEVVPSEPVNSETSSESSEGSNETKSEESKPSGVIIFNEDSYNTYDSENEALKPENIISLPGEIVCGSTVTGVPGENTQRIRFWIDYVSNGKTNKFMGFEEFLFPDNNWTVTDVDFSSYAGETIVIAISSSTGDLIPKSTYNYIAFEIPSDPMKINTTEAVENETETEETSTEVISTDNEELENESVLESVPNSETSKTPSDEQGIGPGFEL